ncbi:MAG: pyridoxamine 5'-phosphate oxidase family protein [Vulcanimicrobiota bacterium]
MNDIEKFVDLLSDFRFCMMTTEGADGRWHTRPMTLQDPSEERAIWFVAVRDCKSAANLRHNPRLQLSFLRSSDGAWITLYGRVEFEDDPELLRDLWQDNWDIWFDEADKFERAVLVNVEPIQIEFWEPEKGRFHQFVDMVKARYSDSSITFDDSIHRLRASAEELIQAKR